LLRFARASASAVAAAAVAGATTLTITVAGDDITRAQPAIVARPMSPFVDDPSWPRQRASSRKGGCRRGVSRLNDWLTALIVQGYSIRLDSAIGAGHIFEKNAGRMRAAYIEKHGGRVHH
jgi:hypothetical protein